MEWAAAGACSSQESSMTQVLSAHLHKPKFPSGPAPLALCAVVRTQRERGTRHGDAGSAPTA